MTTREVLVAARLEYERHGKHTPVGEFPQNGDCCVVTALDRVSPAPLLVANRAVVDALATAADVDREWPRVALIRWNASATDAEVLAAFDRAIAEAGE